MSEALVHGRSGWMNHGCRCPTCHRALRAYSRVHRAAMVIRRGGEPATRVSPRRVRGHVASLRAAGWSPKRIATAAGVSERTMWRIADERTGHVSRIVERLVLDVAP